MAIYLCISVLKTVHNLLALITSEENNCLNFAVEI